MVNFGEFLQAEVERPEAAAEWVPPSSFSRSTKKYWLRPEDEMKLATMVVRHLPILKMGKKDATSVHQHVSSIYLDSADFARHALHTSLIHTCSESTTSTARLQTG